MSSLIYYTPSRFRSLTHLHDIKIWLAMFKLFREGMSFIDRSNIIQVPVKTTTLDNLALPDVNPSFNLSFGDCAINRANELYQQHKKLNVPIRLAWSGGIDSTAALVAFIELLGISEAKKCLEIAMTSASIVENPYVWEKIIRKEDFNIINTAHTTSNWGTDCIITNGEGGDQVQGGDIFRILVRFFGPNSLNDPWTYDKVFFHIKTVTELPDQGSHFLTDMLVNKVTQAPLPIVSISDFWWWINFTCRWGSTFYRLVAKNTTPISNDFINTYYYPFYNSKALQLWSMHMRHEAHKGDWVSYKWKAREFICNSIKSPQYELKHRQGSLVTVITHTHKSEGIDDEFNLYDKIVPTDWYEPNNSFKIQ